ncbi:hypothetical protein E0W79_08950, partial [Klebsiella pneumoniae]|nr:hypothetical protein [Klebsiella pneumoniae]
LMMSLWDALRMNMMISYQELVRTFPKAILNATLRQGIVPGCVRHLIFLLSGNSSETMLTTSIEKYTGQNNQWGVCLRIARHGEFIAATFEKVISDASNS